ncbi:MAG TPA: hypothetical protein PLI09_28790 [Candidatus Hydrogenedentes bacterium]|nr:hypothetical protein [Candidatus Hydrogenedentota bacterium]
MKAIRIILAAVLGFVGALRADDLSNPAVFSTNSAYAAIAGYAIISADGTNALDLLTQETNRAITYDTNLLAITVATTGRVAALEAVDITTTGRVYTLELSNVTVTGQVAALQAVDITTTGRVYALEQADISTTQRVALIEGLTNGAVLGLTAYQPNATNLLTEGYFDVVDTTQLVFMAGGVTNVIDSDITTAP